MESEKPPEAQNDGHKRQLEHEIIINSDRKPASDPATHHEPNGESTKKSKSNFVLESGSSEVVVPSINPKYCTEEFKSSVYSLLKSFADGLPNSLTATNNVSPAANMVFRKPYRHMVFPDFFNGPMDDIETELLSQKFNYLSTDLFQLSQTKELSAKHVTEFASLTEVFRSEVRPWVQDITKIELSEQIDIRGAIYRYTDRLVCHDDKLSTRKVAYVYYVTDQEWCAADGGSLDLFDSICVDDNFVPGEVTKSILPKRNSLVLFIVSDESFHQVCEVLTPRKTRLSLTGWFHLAHALPGRAEFQDHPVIQPVEFFEASSEVNSICRILNNGSSIMEQIKPGWRRQFNNQQFLSIPAIFVDSFYLNLVTELRASDRNLPWIIPSNRNQSGHYRYVDLRDRSAAKELKFLDLVLQSFLTDQFLQFLTEITGTNFNPNVTGPDHEKVQALFGDGLPRHPVASASVGLRWFLNCVQLRLERFEHRDYTLKNFDAVQRGGVVDVFYFIDCEKLEADCGGTIVYIDIDDATDDWEPLTIFGKPNGFAVVRREETMVFYTEYLNHRWVRRNDGRPFYRLWLSIPAAGEEEEESGSTSSGSSREEYSGDDEENEDPGAGHTAVSSSDEE